MILSIKELGLDGIDCKTFFVTDFNDDTVIYDWDDFSPVLQKHIIERIEGKNNWASPSHLKCTECKDILEIQWD